MTPFVSVIIPCYNHGIYLESTINSILQQTWQEMEIIVVDDGSDSATVEILQNITHSRVRVIYQENGKTSKARNTGFKNSSGNYILSIDADDLVDRSFLEKGLSILESNPSIGVVSSWGNCFGHSNYLWMPSGGGIEYFLEDINCSAFALTRREIWQSNGGFDENMTVGYEDWEFWINTTKKGWLIHIIPEFLFHYRIKPGSRAIDAFNARPQIMQYIKQKHKELF